MTLKSIGTLCHDGAKQAPGYFLFYAAQQFHATAKTLHEFYQDLAIHKSLNPDTIISDFDGGASTSSETNVMAIFSGVLGVASAASSVAGPGGAAASAALGSLSGLFAIASEAPGGGGGGGATKDLKHLVNRFFTNSQKLIGSALDDVFGDAKHGKIKKIPKSALTQKGTACTEPVCKFFAEGKWLFYDIDNHIQKFKANVRTRLVSASIFYFSLLFEPLAEILDHKLK
jgi:hypothetical protein